MENISEYSDQELELELEKRKIRKENKRPKPINIKNIKLDLLIIACESYLNDIEMEHETNDNYENDIFEKAIECIYGFDIWNWINVNTD